MTFIKDLAARLNGAAESKADNVSLNGGDPTEWHRGGALTEEVRVAGAARQVIHDTGRSQVAGLNTACTCGSVGTNHPAT